MIFQNFEVLGWHPRTEVIPQFQKFSAKFALKSEADDVHVKEESDAKEFRLQAKGIADRYKSRWGVVVGDIHIIVHACLMTGRKYICGHKGKITLEKQVSNGTNWFLRKHY